MSSPIAMSIRNLGPRVIRPPSSQLVTTQSNRSIWRCARNGQGDKTERISRYFHRYQRYPLYNQQKPGTCRDSNAAPNDTHSSWSWTAWLLQSRFPDLPPDREGRLWDSDLGQTHKRMELLKKYIEADPYSAVFGRRLDPFQNFDKNGTSLNGFLQSLTSLKKPRNAGPGVDKRQTRSDANHAGLQYDPISGRMAPVPLPDILESGKPGAEINSHKVVDCPPGTEVDAKFAHCPSLAEDGQFQPGNTGLSPKALSSSQSTIDCPPGTELNAHFISTPTSQDAQDRLQVPQETKRKPSVKTDCPSGSANSQPDTFMVNRNTNKLNLDAGLTAGTNVEGNEVDAKLSSDLRSLKSEPDSPVRQTTDTATMTGAQESFECSPGSEIEAHILSESASQDVAQPEAQTSVNCPPGSELEANFIRNATSTEENQLRQEVPTGLDTSRITNNVVDCTPGNELEAKFISEMANAQGPNEYEDLSAPDASEIRSRYASLEPKVQANPLDFDASEDRVGDFILESQNLATEKGEQPAASQTPSPKFHIMALDTSTSQVSVARADSFFGVDEDSRPSEILSRLHNPAKFLPYFEKMQEDGYEIATGGGNILVFRKTQSTPHHTLSNTARDEEPKIHAEIAQHLRHDSMDSAATYAGAPRQSTSEVSRQ